MSILYPADGREAVRVAPLDPNAVKKIEVDISDWLAGDTLGAHAWTVSAPNIVEGDGTESKLLGTGNLVTPPASTESAGIVTAYFWDNGEGLRGQDYKVTLSLQAGFRGDDRSFVFELAER